MTNWFAGLIANVNPLVTVTPKTFFKPVRILAVTFYAEGIIPLIIRDDGFFLFASETCSVSVGIFPTTNRANDFPSLHILVDFLIPPAIITNTFHYYTSLSKIIMRPFLFVCQTTW